MRRPLRCDLLVVGAGPAGSALAATVARAGREVVVAEASRHPREKACAEYASPRIADELARLGVPEEAWRRAAIPLDGMHVLVGETRLEIRYRDRAGPRPAWGLDRRAFDAMLGRHAARAGARLLQQSALVGLRIVDDSAAGRPRAVARLRGPKGELEVHADWVVGADGARSATARLLGVDRAVRFPRRLGLVAHFDAVPSGLDDHGEMHVGEAGYVGLAPIPGGRLNVAMALPLDGRTTAHDRFEAAIAKLPAAAARLRDARRLTPIRGVAPIGHRVAATAGPGWLLIGDAAGFLDPFTGEGIFRALRSARAAAGALVGDRGTVVERYLEERRVAFTAKDLLTWLVQGMLASPPMLRYAIRRLASRPHATARLGSALGDCRPASDALTPRFVLEVLRP